MRTCVGPVVDSRALLQRDQARAPTVAVDAAIGFAQAQPLTVDADCPEKSIAMPAIPATTPGAPASAPHRAGSRKTNGRACRFLRLICQWSYRYRRVARVMQQSIKSTEDVKASQEIDSRLKSKVAPAQEATAHWGTWAVGFSGRHPTTLRLLSSRVV